MGRLSVTKGKRWEREVARIFREALDDHTIRRGWQDRSGSDEPDVICPGLWIECKIGKRTNPRAALAQAIGDASPGRVPVAVCKDDRKDPFVVLGLYDFVELVRRCHVQTKTE